MTGSKRLLCRYAALLLLCLPATVLAGTVTFVPVYETGSRWFDAMTGAADRAGVEGMLMQFEMVIVTPGPWNASVEVFLIDDLTDTAPTGAFATTFSNNNATVTWAGGSYQGTGPWIEIVDGGADANGSVVDPVTGAGADCVVNWNFARSAPATNAGLFRHEFHHALGVTSWLGNDMPVMAVGGMITTPAPGTTTSASVYDSRIVDLNGDPLLGSYISGITYNLAPYVVDADWDYTGPPDNGCGIAFVATDAMGGDVLYPLYSYNSGTGPGGVQASHPGELMYAGFHPSWGTLADVDMNFLRALGYIPGGGGMGATCPGLCGDCNGSGSGPDILDAWQAARFDLGLDVPSAAQMGCCDINMSGGIDVLDTLVMAQASAGLPYTPNCP